MEQNPLPIGITVSVNCDKVVFYTDKFMQLADWLEDNSITLPQNIIGSLSNLVIKCLS